MRQVFIALLLMAVPMQNAIAAPKNIQSLLELCKTKQSSPSAHYCLGYIGGVADMMQVIRNSGPPNSILIGACGDITQFTGAAIVQVFINWAEKHPRSWNLEPIVGVTASIKEQLPCRAN